MIPLLNVDVSEVTRRHPCVYVCLRLWDGKWFTLSWLQVVKVCFVLCEPSVRLSKVDVSRYDHCGILCWKPREIKLFRSSSRNYSFLYG